jgi:heterodisulfide reductase subunit A-like polyferredoxin
MKKPKFIPEFDDIPTLRAKMPELALEERHLSFAEVDLGFDEELALAEAARCLSCRRCIGCGLCLAECDRDAIVYDQKPEVATITFDEVVIATGSSSFDASRKPELGYESGMNIVTTAELERMLSPTGPYAGLPLRPGDGTFPRRIAFVQCVGSREEGIGADYCSSTCCTDALELASSLREKLDDVAVTIYHRGMRPVGRRGEELFRAAERGEGPALVMAMVTGVAGSDCEGPVTVTYDTGAGDTEEGFDLVVLSVGRGASDATHGLTRRLRIDANKFRFVSTDTLLPVATSAEGVLAAGSCVRPVDHLGAANSGAATAAVASRSDDYMKSGEAREEEAASSAPDELSGTPAGTPVLVCVCEQGLSVTALDPGELAREVGRLDGVTLAVSLRLACGHDSLRRLRDLAGGLSNARVLVVGCYPRTHGALLKERLAARFPSAGEVSVVGVGSGLTASEVASRAGEVAAHGVPVTLVEPSDSLGGTAPLDIASDPDLLARWSALAEGVSSNPLIDVRLNSTVSAIEPAEGGFVPKIDGRGSGPTVAHGVLIVSTGATDYTPPGRTGSGSGSVLTQAELAASLGAGETGRGKVVMIQCVGSRNDEHPYCSRTCCADALRNALRLKQEDPGCEVTILHRGIRVWGFDEELLSEVIDQGVDFVEVTDRVEAQVEVTEGGKPAVSATGTGGEAVALEPDLVVLSTGVEPSAATAQLAGIAGVDLASDGFFTRTGAVASASGGVHVFACGRACGPAAVHERVLQAQAAAGKACLLLKRGYDEA